MATTDRPLSPGATRRWDELDRHCVNAIRCLAIDGVEQAGSGHPGLPLGAAPMAYVLFSSFLRGDEMTTYRNPSRREHRDG